MTSNPLSPEQACADGTYQMGHGSGGLAKQESGGMSLKGRPVLGLDGQERRQTSVPTEVEQKACQRARLKSGLQQ